MTTEGSSGEHTLDSSSSVPAASDSGSRPEVAPGLVEHPRQDGVTDFVDEEMGAPPPQPRTFIEEVYNTDQEMRWNAFLDEPTPQWKQRKCNMYLSGFALLFLLTSQQRGCNIPLKLWLAV